MVAAIHSKSPVPEGSEPAWDIARLFPAQGVWHEGDYLALDTNHLVEFTDGYVEVLPMPKPAHQRIVLFLRDEIHAFSRSSKLGEVLVAPMRIRLRERKFREPDVMFMLTDHATRKGEEFWEGADLVMEVVSPDAESYTRDYTSKRSDYAEAGVAEYWIIDPQERKVLVLKLSDGDYVVHGEFTTGHASSALLAGFSVEIDAIWAAAGG